MSLISIQVSVAKNKSMTISGLPGTTEPVAVTHALIDQGIFLDEARRYRVVPTLHTGRCLVVEITDSQGTIVSRIETLSRQANVSFEIPESSGLEEARNSQLREHGRVYREGARTVVEIMGKAHLLSEPGVTCANPDAPEAERIYRKVFRSKQIYLAHEYDRAVAEHLHGHNVFVIAMNGYSSIGIAKCREYGIDPGAYEAACERLLAHAIVALQTALPDIDVRVIHGASAMGVDLAIQRCVRGRQPSQELGFSCPKYLFHVEDDEYPVYVADNVHDYSQAFVRSCDALIAANGRLHSFRMDIAAVFDHGKYFLPINILKLISRTGGPAAKNADGLIEDAVAFFEQRMYSVGRNVSHSSAKDPWRALGLEVKETLVSIARHVLPADAAWTL